MLIRNLVRWVSFTWSWNVQGYKWFEGCERFWPLKKHTQEILVECAKSQIPFDHLQPRHSSGRVSGAAGDWSICGGRLKSAGRHIHSGERCSAQWRRRRCERFVHQTKGPQLMTWGKSKSRWEIIRHKPEARGNNFVARADKKLAY